MRNDADDVRSLLVCSNHQAWRYLRAPFFPSTPFPGIFAGIPDGHHRPFSLFETACGPPACTA
jgi:hypothetical protein